jgi:hypothetical protein
MVSYRAAVQWNDKSDLEYYIECVGDADEVRMRISIEGTREEVWAMVEWLNAHASDFEQ